MGHRSSKLAKAAKAARAEALAVADIIALQQGEMNRNLVLGIEDLRCAIRENEMRLQALQADRLHTAQLLAGLQQQLGLLNQRLQHLQSPRQPCESASVHTPCQSPDHLMHRM
eukprot:m.263962 g.263962  ORF g.263962 m.263962 type:complete len:113 (+) comp27407_c0_seq1:89-427(+)